MKTNRIFLIVLLLSAGFAASAQEEDPAYNESVIVTGSYNPVVEESSKINVAPVITDTVATLPHTFNYNVSVRRLTSLYVPSRIKAARIIGEPATKLYNNYFKLGFGNYLSPLAEIYVNSLRSKNMNYGVRLTHRSSWGTIGTKGDSIPSPEYYGMAPFSLTDVGVFGKYITKNNLQLSGDLGFENDYNRYYGFSDSTLNAKLGLLRDSITPDQYKALYNLVDLNLGLKSLNTDAGALGYAADVKVQNLWGSYGQRELRLGVDGGVHYGFALGKKGQKGILYLRLGWEGFNNDFSPADLLPLGADTSRLLTPLQLRDSAGRSSLASRGYRSIYRANPYIDFLLNGYQIHAGALIGIDNYNSSTDVTIHVYPDVTVSKAVVKDVINFGLGVTGGLDAVTWNDIRKINPYVAPDADIRATSHYEAYGDLRLNFSKKMELDIRAGYALLNDDLSFRLKDSYGLGNVFEAAYDSLSRFNVGATFTFVNDEMLTFQARGNYYAYTSRMASDEPLYYRPSYDAGLLAKVNYHDKWIGHLEFNLLSPTAYGYELAADGTRQLLTLPLRYGLNLEVEYRHTKALSFFLKADNLLFQRYYYWQNYPSQRALFILGLTYTIPY